MRVVQGFYHLRIRLRRSTEIAIGALGTHRLPAGWYIYTGSARNGLLHRVGRHLRRDKPCHWHIDRLTAICDGIEPYVHEGADVTECQLHDRMAGGRVVVPGFGASDCACPSHLAWFGRRPEIGLEPWSSFFSRIHDVGVLHTHRH